jgi:pyroglutamyl-peptidase
VKTVLLTGFEPFDGDTLNPSWEVARELAGETAGGARVVSVQLPCVFAHAPSVLAQALGAHEPHAVLCLGQAEGRSEITPERVAINVMQARIPDNAGEQPQDVPVISDGPAAYFSTLPLNRIVQRLREQNVPSSISNTAGTYVCNQVFYLLQHTWGHETGRCSGFVHLPCLPQQVARRVGTACPSMSLTLQVQAIREIVRLIMA